MLRLVKVRGCVFVRGGIAAADVSALEAFAEVDPGAADFEAVLAAFGAGRYFFDVGCDVAAGCGHGAPCCAEPSYRR